MRIYWQIFSVGIQNTLVYRVNFFSRALFNLLPLVAFIAMWRAVYDGKSGEIAGYSLSAMISYYLLVTIVEALTAVTEDDWQIAADIKDGHISQFLTRPIDYLHYRFCLFCSGRIVYAMAAAAPVAFFVFLHRGHLVAPANGLALGCFIVSLALSAVLQFLLSYLVAMLAFWVLEISTFAFVLLAFERLASGQMFPLDIMPAWMVQATLWTPFPYAIFFPVSVYLGKTTGLALAQGMAIQCFWVVACYGAARRVWSRGLKTYTVVGG